MKKVTFPPSVNTVRLTPDQPIRGTTTAAVVRVGTKPHRAGTVIASDLYGLLSSRREYLYRTSRGRYELCNAERGFVAPMTKTAARFWLDHNGFRNGEV